MDTKPDRAERTGDDFRNVLIAHFFQKTQHQDFPMFGGEFVQSGVNALRVGRRIIFVVRLVRQIGFGERARQRGLFRWRSAVRLRAMR